MRYTVSVYEVCTECIVGDLLDRESCGCYSPGQDWNFKDETYIYSHRIDGPANTYLDTNEKLQSYKGEFIECSSQEEFERIIKLKAFW